MSLPKTFVEGFHDEASAARMEYRSFGRTNMTVSKISLGGGTFSNFYGFDENEAIATVHAAIKAGINYLDTAPYYGQGRSEQLYGKALKDIPRKAYYIATKVGRYDRNVKTMFDFSAKKTRESVEQSLKWLDLDYVDVIQIHDIEFAPNLEIILNETLPELEKLVAEGKAKYIGVTGYPLQRLKDILLAAPGRFDMVLSYSRNTLFDNSLADYLPFFMEQHLGIVCASGHGMGLLTNSGPQLWHPANDHLKTICQKAVKICNTADIELGKLAMYFAMELNGPSTFLTGMQTRKLLSINISSYYDGLNEKEQEIMQLLKETLFNQSTNWEGIEVDRYWQDMAAIKQ